MAVLSIIPYKVTFFTSSLKGFVFTKCGNNIF